MIDREVFARNRLVKYLGELHIHEHAVLIKDIIEKLKKRKISVDGAKKKLGLKVRELSQQLWEVERFLKELE